MVKARFVALTFFLVGLGLLVFFVWDAVRSEQSRHWESVECHILRSEIAEVKPYKLDVAYSYDVDGRHYVSDRLRFDYVGSGDYYAAQKLLDKYPAGSTVTGLVDPGVPSESILEPKSRWAGLWFLGFAFVFMFLGAAGFVMVGGPRDGDGSNGATWIIPIFFGMFLAVGVATLFGKFLPSLARGRAADNWPRVACVVDRSEVGSHSDSHGTTYSVDVLYEYEFEGRRYKSSRYALEGVQTSDRDEQVQVVRSLPAGKHAECFVNPLDPADAVMNLSQEGLVLVGGISILFTLVGAIAEIGVGYFLVQNWRSKHPAPLEHLIGGFVEMKMAHHPITKALPFFGFAFFWCALTTIFVMLVGLDWMKGVHEWGPVIITTVFTVVGVVLTCAASYLSLAGLYPLPRVAISQMPVQMGQPVQIRWHFDNPGRIASLAIQVVAVAKRTNEISGYRALQNLWICDLISTKDPKDIRSGGRTLVIPHHAVPRVKGGVVLWAVLVDGKAPGLPGLEVDYPFTVDSPNADATT